MELVIILAHIHSTESELRFGGGSNSALGVSGFVKVRPLTMFVTGNKTKTLSLVSRITQYFIIVIFL